MNTIGAAAVLFDIGKPLKILDLVFPPLKPGQVLVDVAYSGICQSQLLEVRGKRGHDRFLPHTLGHEGSGTVEAVGDGVQKVKVGDRVVLSWIKGTGADVPSTVYGSSEGPVNSGAISTFMHRTITCENRVVRIPDSMPLREAALLGCAVATGAGIVFNTAQVTPGVSLAVFGMGGVGLSSVLAASAAQAKTIVAVDPVWPRLELAQKLGATNLLNSVSQDPVEAIMDLTDGQGVDYCIEAAGSQDAMEASFRAVRASGGLCVLAGNLPHGNWIRIDPFDLIRGKRIMGSWGGATVPDRDIPRYADLYLAGKLRLDAMIGREYLLTEINQALDDLERGRISGRGLIAFSE